MLEPADIVAKEFSATRFREGYDQVEVDDFLDRIKADYEAVLEQLAAERNRRREADTTRMKPVDATPSEKVQKLLELAQKTADQAVDEGNAQAHRVVSEAHAQAQQIVNEAHSDRQAQINQLSERQEKLQQAVDDLETRARNVRTALQGTLASFDTALDEGGESDG